MSEIAAEAASSAAPETGAGTAIVLKSSEFRRGREAGWRELEDLVSRVERRGITALGADELQRLPLLYRATLSALSVARSIALDRNMLLYLENLALRAFLVVYGPRGSLLHGVSDFLRNGFPAAVRGARWHLLIAVFALALGTAAGFLLVVNNEDWFSSLVPDWLAGGRGPKSTRADLYDHEIFAPAPSAPEAFGIFANLLFSHNTKIGLLTFALGIVAGVPTLLLLVYQGLGLGAFLALHYNRGLAFDFTGWVAIHGVTELLAIALCGAAGLVVAQTALFPGRYSRLENLALNGRSAASIALGAMLLFLVAGILEGGFRQLVHSTELRLTIGGVSAVLWLAYFAGAGRGAPR